jgi:hypothetical protein
MRSAACLARPVGWKPLIALPAGQTKLTNPWLRDRRAVAVSLPWKRDRTVLLGIVGGHLVLRTKDGDPHSGASEVADAA